MKPIGLRIRHDGELMIVHQCLSCGKIVNNRIAGDDLPDAILMLIPESSDGRNLLTKKQIPEIRTVLYGKIHY